LGVYNQGIIQKNIHIYVVPLEYTFLSYITRECKLSILKKNVISLKYISFYSFQGHTMHSITLCSLTNVTNIRNQQYHLLASRKSGLCKKHTDTWQITLYTQFYCQLQVLLYL